MNVRYKFINIRAFQNKMYMTIQKIRVWQEISSCILEKKCICLEKGRSIQLEMLKYFEEFTFQRISKIRDNSKIRRLIEVYTY